MMLTFKCFWLQSSSCWKSYTNAWIIKITLVWNMGVGPSTLRYRSNFEPMNVGFKIPVTNQWDSVNCWIFSLFFYQDIFDQGCTELWILKTSFWVNKLMSQIIIPLRFLFWECKRRKEECQIIDNWKFLDRTSATYLSYPLWKTLNIWINNNVCVCVFLSFFSNIKIINKAFSM